MRTAGESETGRIFCNDAIEGISKQGNIVVCGYYHRYWNADRTRNRTFDTFSGKILDVKQKREDGFSYFFPRLDKEICENVSICVVPSHKAGMTNESGVAELARRLARNGRVDRVDFLIRKRAVYKLAHGGCREVDFLMDSLGVQEGMTVRDEAVLLMDDVSTSGASLKACRKILLNQGAKRVALLALGKSVSRDGV